MSRSRRRYRARRGRRRSHGPTEDCVIARPPTADEDAWFGFCEHLGLWRIKIPPFDAYGVIDSDGGLDRFHAALDDAAQTISEDRPELARWLRALRQRPQP